MPNIYTSVRNYVRKHQRTLTITASIITGAYLVGKYAIAKITEFQERAEAERVARENLRRRFEQNQQDCTFTVLSLLPTLSDQLLHEPDVEAIWARLQQNRKTERVVSVSTTSPTPSPSASSTLTDSENGHKSNEGARNGNAAAGSPTSTSSPTTSSPTSETPSSRRGDEDMTTSTTSLMASTGSLGAVSTAWGESSVLIGTSPSGGTGSMVMVDKKSKYQLWEELKVASFTRTLTSLYVLVLITLLTHIQLNLLGRFTYISSVAALNRDEPTIRLEKSGSGSASHSRGVLDFETERRFLGFSWWILHRGWRVVKERVEKVVEGAVGSMALKQATTYVDIVGLVDRIRAGVEYEVQEHGSDAQRVAFDFRPTMLPDDRAEERDVLVQAGFIETEAEGESDRRTEGEEARVEAEVRRLLDETRDFIDSPDFQTVLHSCLDEVFSLFLPNTFAKTFFPLDPPAFDVPKIREITRQEEEGGTVPVAVPLANLLPAVSRQVHLVVNGAPNEYVKTLAYIKELQGFSAIIYSSFEEVVAAT